MPRMLRSALEEEMPRLLRRYNLLPVTRRSASTTNRSGKLCYTFVTRLRRQFLIQLANSFFLLDLALERVIAQVVPRRLGSGDLPLPKLGLYYLHL